MCRFAAYLGEPIALDELLYRPEHSIISQATNPGEGPLNGDGFGVGWYAPRLDEGPALYRTSAPAWADENMKTIAPRVETSLFFAHVRGASPGMNVQETNCHPFAQDRLLFMHNGHIKGYDRILRALRRELPDEVYFNIGGTTDSEHLFAVIQHELGDAVQDPSPRDLADAVQAALRRVGALKREQGVGDEPTRANLALTDGRSLVALRYADDDQKEASTLFMTRGEGLEKATKGEGVFVSSDPMVSGDEVEVLPENHLVIVTPDGRERIEPVKAA